MTKPFNWKKENESFREKDLFRSLRSMEPDPDRPGRIKVDGASLVLLSSNDYLGFSRHPRIQAAAIRAIQQFGSGSGAARLLSGNIPPIRELEEQTAAFKGTEAALVFNTGYAANLGLLSSILPENGLVLADRLCHASLIEGCRISGCRFRVFSHGNVSQIEKAIMGRKKPGPALIVTEGLFSMDGDISPLPELFDVARRTQAMIYLDDAHGTGVLGKTGRGTLEHFGISSSAVIQMGTFGKAFGSFGAFIAGTRDLIDFLVNTARTFIYSTALPPAAAAASLEALRTLEEEPEHLEHLRRNITRLRTNLREGGFAIPHGESPIIPIRVGESKKALEFSEALRERGVFAPAIRPPTVPRGTSRIRLSVMASHTDSDIDLASEAIIKTARKMELTQSDA